MIKLMQLLQPLFRWLVAYGHFSRRINARFYLGLSVILSMGLVGYVLYQDHSSGGEGAPYNAGTLDSAMKYRFSGPAPSDDIVIIDIDERSLAKMAEEYGRWPWPRSVFAELLLSLDEIGTQSIVFNLMFSDADIKDPDSDELFAYAASELKQVVYPITRLPEKNDDQSEVEVGMLQGAEYQTESFGRRTVAVIYPYFETTHGHLGVNNLIIEDDGIIRKSFLRYQDKGFSLAGITSRVIEHLGQVPHEMPNDYLINWRNKRGAYQRVPFVDVYASLTGADESFDMNSLAGKVVIIGATAPGLAIPKVTPVDRSADDNMIIANAIDDAINNTYLRPISLWMQALMGCLFLLLLALLYLRGISGTIIDVVFWIAQSAAVAITVISVSYTPYLFDLTLLVYAGMAFYIIEKVHTFSVERSRIGIHPFKPNFDFNEVITLRCEIDEQRPQEYVYCKFEETFGHKNVFFINELFSDESILADSLPSASYIIVNAEQAAVEATIAALPSQLGESLAILRAVANIDSNDSAEYFQEITRRCLENALHTINA
jgi:CHASE2 domain-containing sensor protein